MAKQVSLKAGGSTVLPVDIVSMATFLSLDGGLTDYLDEAVVILRRAGHKPCLFAHNEAFDACITLARLMNVSTYSPGLQRVFEVAANILPTSR
jgi:hypothetical protein